MEERKKSQTGRFMKDGFDRWAESSTPARVGQMEKEPAESTNTMPRQMTEREVGGVLPLLAPAAMAAAPYVLPAAAGLATGIYAGVRGERGVQKMRQQIAREERAKRGGVLPLLPAAAVAAAPYVLPAAAGFATGIYAGVKGQRKVDSVRQQIAREERAKYGGMGMPVGAGFREGVRETQNMYGNLADAAIYGFDTYEHAKKGVTGLPAALRSGAQVAEATMKVKNAAARAAAEFQKGSGRKMDTAVNLGVSGLAGYKAVQSGKQAKGAFEEGDYSGALRSGVDAAQMGLLSGVAARQAVKSATGKGRADGRSARAAIVKQVMAQRGVSMIEASKIVKAEGLY
jgi:hypothetical protein